MKRLRPVATAAALLAFAVSGVARADEPPITVSHGLSPYEDETLAIAEHDHHLTPDPHPEGKIVEAIEYARFDVIDKRDPLPEWVDIFHATTTAAVLGREVLQPVGAPFRQDLADETERNLRTYAQLSVVLVRAERGSRPDRVKLLLVTKDVWSLRLNWNFGIGQGGLQFLDLQTTEINLAGTLQSVTATFNELPRSVLYGVSYVAPRLDGHWLRFAAGANIIVNRDTGSPEGTAGSAHIARPLFSTRTEWSWGVGSSWLVDVNRRYINTDVAQYRPSTGAAQNTPAVPWEWNERNFTETVAATRSFGLRNKDDVTFGFEMNVRGYTYPTATRDIVGAAPSGAAIDQFLRAEAPVSDTRVGPFVQWHHYKTDFLRLYDVDTLSLQEDFRLGLDTYLRAYPVAEALGSTRNFVGSYAAVQDTWSVGDGLLRVLAENTTEAQSSHGLAVSDGRIDADVHFVSPKTAAGRLVVDGYGLDRYRNYLNLTSVIGGDTRLRGYPSGAFLGKSLLAGNAEWRTRGLDIFKCIFAAVAFYDAGDAFDSFAAVHLKQSVGAGVRAVFPQLERLVARLDVGVPLVDRNMPGVAPAAFYLTFGQAIGVGQVSPPGGVGTDGNIGAVNQVGVLGY